MIAKALTVAFSGVDARLIDVQCALSPGLPSFQIVGLPDKAVSEAKERVRVAISALGIALPSKRITINLAPADLPKYGSHFDLPIALALLAAMEILPVDELERHLCLGELYLDGGLVAVSGCLPAAILGAEHRLDIICPFDCGPEAAWIHDVNVIAPQNLLAAINHLNGKSTLPAARPGEVRQNALDKDLSDVKGQETAKRALEIAAAGRHHIFMNGPPGSGKSMLASRLIGLLPELDAQEALETSMIHSLSGLLEKGGISKQRPYRDPHHTASMASIVGGGRQAKPGEISLAHNGVLFLDELPEFSKPVLETLRQPIETGNVMISRANAHVRYPCRFMLIAAANPCRCGYMSDASRACGRAPLCGQDYLGRVSGPLIDRFDIHLNIHPVEISELQDIKPSEPSTSVAARVNSAWNIQRQRYAKDSDIRLNADLDGQKLEEAVELDREGREILGKAAERFNLSARGYHRLLRVSRTIADLDGEPSVRKPQLTEAICFRQLAA